jgi:hypothetical protein
MPKATKRVTAIRITVLGSTWSSAAATASICSVPVTW